MNIIYRYAGWTAYGDAVITLTSILALSLFFALIPMLGTDNIFGPINDLTAIISALLSIPILIALAEIHRDYASPASQILLLTGILAALAVALLGRCFSC